MKITELNPQEVFFYFNQISSIPHGSGNTENITKYCVNFAAEHGLQCYHGEM